MNVPTAERRRGQGGVKIRSGHGLVRQMNSITSSNIGELESLDRHYRLVISYYTDWLVSNIFPFVGTWTAGRSIMMRPSRSADRTTKRRSRPENSLRMEDDRNILPEMCSYSVDQPRLSRHSRMGLFGWMLQSMCRPCGWLRQNLFHLGKNKWLIGVVVVFRCFIEVGKCIFFPSFWFRSGVSRRY